MQVVNKKYVKVTIIMVLMLIGLTSTYMAYKSYMKKDNSLDEVKLRSNSNNSMFAIMLDQGDGTYAESSSNTWPTDGYLYNEEKSGCIDKNGNGIDGALTYENGIATIKSNTTSYCYLYFDLIKDDVTIAISTDGEEGAMPISGSYANSATCMNSTISWNQKYQRIEIDNLSKVGDKCNLNFTKDTSTKTLLIDEVEAKTTTNTNGYRYSGANPNNYIWFNNEMWRIIGSIPTCTSSGCNTSNNLVKIMRNESIGGLAYDAKTTSSSSTGAWGSNTLYTLLNSYYYGGLDATGTDYCYAYKKTAKAKCDYTTTGIDGTSYYGRMIENVYWNTGASDYNYAGAVYTNEIATRTVSGYIGLMSASDYGYSADSSYHNTSIASYNTLAITGSNWLYSQGYEWINIQNASSSMYALYVKDSGVMNRSYAYYGYVVRPVVYLDSSVYIVSGDGTEANPYQIGM